MNNRSLIIIVSIISFSTNLSPVGMTTLIAQVIGIAQQPAKQLPPSLAKATLLNSLSTYTICSYATTTGIGAGLGIALAYIPIRRSIGDILLAFGLKFNCQRIINWTRRLGANIQPQVARKMLHEAACNGTQQRIRALLAAGVNIEARDTHQRTPLHWAARFGRTRAVLALLEAHANIEVQDDQQFTSLHLAAFYGYIATIRALISRGARINQRDSRGKTPLHLAAANGLHGTARTLISSHADINARAANGMTPLHFAAFYGHQLVAEELIAARANVALTNREHRNPQQIAIMRGHANIAELIRRYIASMVVCPICLLRRIELDANDHAKTPCCRQFICRDDFVRLRARGQACPLCRSREGWD